MIAIFTDFGYQGPYLGQMTAQIYRYNPSVPVVHLMNDVPAYSVSAAAHLLRGVGESLPNGTVFLCVVDPGVGGKRRPLAVKCDENWYIGPDNGLFSQVTAAADSWLAYEIIVKPNQICPTFHGRDIFAPIAAQIAKGNYGQLSKIDSIQNINERLTAEFEVIYQDSYGNCWTSARREALDPSNNLRWQLVDIPYAPFFEAVKIGQPFWYFNSSGFVEVAVNQGDARKKLGLNIGDILTLT